MGSPVFPGISSLTNVNCTSYQNCLSKGYGPYLSNDQSGCITFLFNSNGAPNGTGWVATFDCVPCASGPNGIDNNDCSRVTPLCANSGFSDASTGPGISADVSDNCLVTETYSNWYSFNVADGATPSAVFAASHQNGGTYYLPVAWFDGSGTELGSYDYIVNGGSSFVDATIPLGTLAQGTCYMHLASNACGTSYRFTMNGVSAMGLVQLPANRAPIRVVPNPSTDGIFTLSAPFRAVRVQLMDVEGRKLMDEPVSTMFGSITLDTSRFPPGTYTAHLMGADGSTGHVRLMRIH